MADGTPGELSERAGASTISFDLPDGAGAERLPQGLPAGMQVDGARVVLRTTQPTAVLGVLAGWAADLGTPELSNLALDRPSLEDGYLELTR